MMHAMAGRELTYLCEAAMADLVVSVDEARRIRDQYRRDLTSIRMQICRYYETSPCRSGENCEFVGVGTCGYPRP